MRNKLKIKLKFLASLATIPIVASPLIFSVAANEDGKQENNNGNNQDPNQQKKPKIPKNDPNFNIFKTVADKTVKDSLEKGINAAIVYVKSRQEEILENKEIEFKKKIQQLIYLKNLQSYLEKNKENILKNSNDYGFYLNTPQILGTLKNYDIKDIEFNGEIYKQIKVGKTDPLNYQKAIAPKGKISDVQSDQINDVEETKYKDTLKKYESEFLKEINKLIYDENDVPQINKDVELTRDEKGQFNTTLPKGYNDWNAYFISKIKDRVTAFDLKQNQQTNEDKQEEQPNEQKDPDTPPPLPPPLVEGDHNEIDLPPAQANAIVSSLPLLLPYISPIYSNESLSELKSKFDSLKPELKQTLFYFNNPINTRYLYSVLDFGVNGSSMINIKVKIIDQVNPKLQRTYIINKYDPILDLSFNSLKLNEVNAIKQIFVNLYKHLGLDEKIDYKKLRNFYIRNALFTMIEAAQKLILRFNQIDKDNKVIGQKTFATLQNEYLEKYKQKFVNNADNERLLNEFSNLTKENFFRYLNNTLINNDYYWYQLVGAYKQVSLQFSEVLRLNKDKIKANIASIKGDENTIANLYKLNNQLIYQLSAIVAQRSFNSQQWYQSYLNVLQPIKENFDLMSILTNQTDIKTNKDKAKDFKNAYDSALKSLERQKQVNKQIRRKIGIAFIVISLLVLIINLIIYGLIKKLKNKKVILIINSVIMVLTIIVLIMGIILII
ncbi:MSC_0620 family F1-like ATPase-associated subunit [Ureaplasma urealyticum]|uniref:Transmembrane protein n=2 Tax=Ureaplasma urealyticum TaxID=2130 RepID=A0AAP9ABT0_UREUR|nr:hypothetical protein [Ureaplasma urealyticum]EDX54175.1 conserved hypothetical protein [Ureaplasma urealyticum serovar 9 str. ATCC 33175]EDT49567.1 conserved hypothetical protein [Ureaplasma urealyticum serovar 13 str. ATCC 33698]EDX53149.1 conserved hypothetical protein [Ureaplasma urealyticum serovar 12 str. ATCC 33696]EDY74597.1 conserved hypothetical protein [Ureaplasma urealyticum serovar 4 str. ATCC 27816]MCF1348736.1 hypothetical protein [Ureaplasma urealyticum]